MLWTYGDAELDVDLVNVIVKAYEPREEAAALGLTAPARGDQGPVT